jgi:hypothetical protein
MKNIVKIPVGGNEGVYSIYISSYTYFFKPELQECVGKAGKLQKCSVFEGKFKKSVTSVYPELITNIHPVIFDRSVTYR